MTTRSIPNESRYDTTSFVVLLNGNALDATFQILSIAINKDVNRIPTAKIIFRDGDASEENFQISEDGNFEPGTNIEIQVGRDSQNITIFKGIILKQRIKIRNNGTSTLTVDCKDEAVKLTIGRHCKYFENLSDSDAIQQILNGYSSLQSEVESTSFTRNELVQFHVSDWDFILSRAELNGRLVIVDDGKIMVKSPSISSPVLDLLHGQTIYDLDAEMDARYQWKNVESRSWDYANQDIITQSVSSTSFQESGNLSGNQLSDTIALEKLELLHSGRIQQEELREWANSYLLKSRLAKIRGTVTFEGYAEIKPGDTIDLAGLGERFNGNSFISGVRQELNEGEWYTIVQFGLSPQWFSRQKDAIAPPASGILPAINGLQVGKVVKLEGDPDGEDRIQVRVPIIDNQASGVWARIATLDAGQNRGTVFRPEIDDEVIIGFINDDPRDPVVLGMMHSSAKAAPIPASDDNHEKGFTTRSDMHIVFNDDLKKITINTPEGNQIILDESETKIIIKDQNDNIVELKPEGIDIKSPKDINIEAQQNITIKATQDIKLEGLNVKGKAQSSLEMKGATTKMVAQGISEIQGSLIKIN